MKYILLFFTITFIVDLSDLLGQQFTHSIAAIEENKFHGWPANNGIWQWGDEILVGFTQGEYVVKNGHNISGIEKSMFSRSLNGGDTWVMFDPDNFLDDENIKWQPTGKRLLTTPLNFRHDGFAMRIFASGYHGNADPEGGFYYSYDRGATWNGPYYLGNIHNHKELIGKEITARTDYIINGEKEMILFISANPQSPRKNRIASIRTIDGGITFDFVSWVTPINEDFNPHMSSTIQFSENKYILAHRNRYFGESDDTKNSIEVYASQNGADEWKHLSTVKQFDLTSGNNSNPPALIKLKDGRILCIYGDRSHNRIAGKFSLDGGKTWEKEFIIREDFEDLSNSNWDFGYPVLLQREDGKLVAIYYWATSKNPQQFIAVSILEPNY